MSDELFLSIVLVVMYIVFGVCTGVLVTKDNQKGDDIEETVFVGAMMVFWPLVVSVAICMIILLLCGSLCRFIGRKIG